MFGRGAPSVASASCARRIEVEVVSSKRFLRDLQHGVVTEGCTWVGLLQDVPSEGMVAAMEPSAEV